MKKFAIKGVLALFCLSILPGAAFAEEALKVLEGIEIHGFASSSYTFNFNEPTTATNSNRVFDTDHNSLKFDIGELVLLKEASNPGDIGFRTDISYGFSVPEITKSGSKLTDSTGGTVTNDDFDLQQGYVSYNAPVGKGLVLDFGKFITHMGAEVIEGYDGWNYNFSRSFLFGLAIPFTHTGLRASYAISDKVSVMGMLANGWDNTTDNNSGKTLGAQIAIAPTDNVSFLLNWVGGPERPDSDDLRNVFDMVLDVALTNKTLFQLNADVGFEENSSAVTAGDDALWWGFSGIIRHDYSKWFSMNLRGEFFKDDDGVRAFRGAGLFGHGHELWEITVTPEFRISQNLIVRMEYRHDESNRPVFNDDNRGFQNTQDTVAVNGLFYF